MWADRAPSWHRPVDGLRWALERNGGDVAVVKEHTPDAAEMNRLVRLWGTSVGRKLITAATGVFLLVFLLGHIYGNMKVFQGPEALNVYAAWLQGHPLLWVFRIGLVGGFGVHIYLTLSLARDNRRARPTAYARWRPQTSGTSRFMAISGLFILAFLIYHLLHFTLGVIQVDRAHLVDAERRLDVYAMVVQSFRNPWVALIYVVAMVLVGIHLVHGTVSAFQTFGVYHESYVGLVRVACLLLVAAIVLGSASIPILILLGRIGLTGGTAP